MYIQKFYESSLTNVNDSFNFKPLHCENFTNSFQNFYIGKHGSNANTNANFHLQNNYNNYKNILSSKASFIHKGNENSENIEPNHPENGINNEISILNQKQIHKPY